LDNFCLPQSHEVTKFFLKVVISTFWEKSHNKNQFMRYYFLSF
jgi:hypothetical protein